MHPISIIANAGFWEFLNHPFAISAVVTFSIMLVALLIWIIVSRQASKNVRDENVAHRIRHNILSVTILLTVLAIAAIWAGHVKMELSAGLIGAGVALAMQNVILCLSGWFAIALRRIYDVGDRIEVDTTIGDVLDIGLMHTTLLEISNQPEAQQSTGRVVTIPNKVVFTGHVFNFTKGFPFMWNDLCVAVTFESDWRAAKEIMLELAQANAEEVRSDVAEHIRKMRRKMPIRFQHLTPIVYTRIVDHGIELALRYLTGSRRRRGARSDLSEQILEAFDASAGIALAYPTQRITGVGAAEARSPVSATRRRKPKPPSAKEDR